MEAGLQLFRLELPGAAPRTGVLAQGLRRHLAVAPLLSVAVRIEARQQFYVALAGCGGCAHDRCVPGCRAELLRRTLRGAFGAAADVLLVARGLALRPYRRVALAWPTPAARMPTGELLHAYGDARLTLSWRAAPKGLPRVSAMLLAGDAGPDPAATLRACGWRSIALPRRLAPRAQALFILPWAGPWPHAPALLLAEPAPAPMSPPAAPPAGTAEEDHARLRRSTYLHLRAILDGQSIEAALGAPPATPADAAPGWPAGPGTGRAAMSPADVADLARALLESHDVMHGDSPGLSRKRVAALLAERHKQHAGTLLGWFTAAGLLAAPADPEQPDRSPRVLLATDPPQIAELLRAAPWPGALTTGACHETHAG